MPWFSLAITRLEERSNFREIMTQDQDHFAEVLKQNQKQFTETLNEMDATSQHTERVITGGNSYVTVMPFSYKQDDKQLDITLQACIACRESIPSTHVYLKQVAPTVQESMLIFEGQVDPGYSQFGRMKLTPSTVAASQYVIQVFARNKPTVELLNLRFNKDKNIWEFSFAIWRQMKSPHWNPKTKLAEGAVEKLLITQPWGSSHYASLDHDKTTVH